MIGTGEFSDVVEIAMAAPPSKPNSPTKVYSLSSTTSITVVWDDVVTPVSESPGGDITFYQLFMDDGLFGDFKLITKVSSSLTQITISDLIKGRSYRFKVIAEHFNQEGPESDTALLYACMAPTGLSAPKFIDTTATYMSLQWSEPSDNGGCPLLSYYLMRDDGVT
jgi:hypothetical protein